MLRHEGDSQTDFFATYVRHRFEVFVISRLILSGSPWARAAPNRWYLCASNGRKPRSQLINSKLAAQITITRTAGGMAIQSKSSDVEVQSVPAPHSPLLPRFVRFCDAPDFFGMDKDRFNREIQPQLTGIRIGQQGRALDRLAMEAAAEEYTSRNGVPVAHLEWRKPAWEIKKRQASPSRVGSGMSTSSSEDLAFSRAPERSICGKSNGLGLPRNTDE